MSKALVTLATGDHQKLLDIALPSFQRFADTHGYELIVNPDVECARPVSWWKVPILKACLEEFDEALWVDADVVIVDDSQDLEVPADCWQALVRHRTNDGDVPNCGVWLVRQPMTLILDQVWAQTHRLAHGWWEQSALMDLMGFRVDPPARVVAPTVLYDRTFWLDNGFNWHMWDTPGPEHVRFAHATMYPDREAVMREWAAA